MDVRQNKRETVDINDRDTLSYSKGQTAVAAQAPLTAGLRLLGFCPGSGRGPGQRLVLPQDACTVLVSLQIRQVQRQESVLRRCGQQGAPEALFPPSLAVPAQGPLT